jgi:hypothetical protein
MEADAEVYCLHRSLHLYKLNDQRLTYRFPSAYQTTTLPVYKEPVL